MYRIETMKRSSLSEDESNRSSQRVLCGNLPNGGLCKRLRLSRFFLCHSPLSSASSDQTHQQESSRMMSMLPLEIIGKCLSFMHSSRSRYALCSTCRDFHRLCNKHSMLRSLDIEGDSDTDERGIIMETDSKDTAFERLIPFAKAGNLSALHMMGSIRCYCFDDGKDKQVIYIVRICYLLHVVYIRTGSVIGRPIAQSAKSQYNILLTCIFNFSYS